MRKLLDKRFVQEIEDDILEFVFMKRSDVGKVFVSKTEYKYIDYEITFKLVKLFGMDFQIKIIKVEVL